MDRQLKSYFRFKVFYRFYYHLLLSFQTLVLLNTKLDTLQLDVVTRNSGPAVCTAFYQQGALLSHVGLVVMLIPFLCHLTAGVDSATEVYGYLHSLWGFLKRYSVQLMEATHLCCWISLLFGEQDDDMMEAAKALLSIFLHHRYSRCTDLHVMYCQQYGMQRKLVGKSVWLSICFLLWGKDTFHVTLKSKILSKFAVL